MLSGKESRVGVGLKPQAGALKRLHPHVLFTYLGVSGIFFMFCVLLVAYASAQLYTVKDASARLPFSFFVSSCVLVVSSGTIWLACRAQKAEQYKATIAWLTATVSLGLMFLALQLIGWNALQLQGIYVNGFAAGSYLYLISGLHLLHVVAGLVLVVWVMSFAVKATIDNISALIYSTDKYRKLQLNLVATYWHFMGALWLLIYLVFYLLAG